MTQTPKEKAVAIKLKKQIMRKANSKRDEKTTHIVQEIIMQNDLAKNERRRQMKNQWQRQGRSFRGKHTDGYGHYLNKDGEYIGSTNPLFGKEYLEPIQSRKGTEWHVKQLGKIDDV